jgi:hypothetical protein
MTAAADTYSAGASAMAQVAPDIGESVHINLQVVDRE